MDVAMGAPGSAGAGSRQRAKGVASMAQDGQARPNAGDASAEQRRRAKLSVARAGQPRAAAEGGKRARLTTTSGSVARELADKAAPARVVHGVSRLSRGQLKMVGVPHRAAVSMVIPEELKEAWNAEARAQGRSKTDLFEDVLLRYLRSKGWKLEG